MTHLLRRWSSISCLLNNNGWSCNWSWLYRSWCKQHNCSTNRYPLSSALGGGVSIFAEYSNVSGTVAAEVASLSNNTVAVGTSVTLTKILLLWKPGRQPSWFFLFNFKNWSNLLQMLKFLTLLIGSFILISCGGGNNYQKNIEKLDESMDVIIHSVLYPRKDIRSA